VLPEVKARQAEEAAAKQAERVKLAQAIAAGKGPKLPAVSRVGRLLVVVLLKPESSRVESV